MHRAYSVITILKVRRADLTPLNLDSHLPAAEIGGGVFGLQLHGTGGIPGIPYPVGNTSSEAGLPDNIAPGDPGPNLASLGIHTIQALSQLNLDMTFVSPTGIYDITSVSFAVNANGNGYLAARVEMSTDGVTFTIISAAQTIPANGTMTFNITSGTTTNMPVLFLRINFVGGRSNGVDLQNQIDNIQINGTIVPEPATVAGGLLGVLGLCWFQRRRLIGSLRLRRRHV